ncbi:MAG TPA: hypothetical protein H9873_06265 [Candidatus Dorea gallistercoris]|uniref:Chromosome segregation protein SMC n=1 Tax=Candidatus Dorea gallistercoris TaxID=2838542 RepID=A0A9D1RC90_9FIRM|nr:hypothetical protein [Candidatus Dorea gallistercoris]
MILLTKVRLINWYAFSNETGPLGQFTLIAGKNGNGKSVLLDAIKYAAYGDTVFNKSSESKGSRTLSSYTRGFLDVTAGTCMRPADRYPTVYTHIVLEYFDDVADKPFVLGAVIETSAANNCQTLRYALDGKRLEEISHTYTENGVTRPYSASGLQKAYGMTLMNREQGLPKFLQMTGMKMGLSQLPAYLRRLRGIMSYDPDARVERFIRESVLEEKRVDFTKLIEAKENIERLNHTFQMVEAEVKELENILREYDAWDTEKNRLLTDDIKRVYKKKKELEREIEDLKKEKELAGRQKEEQGQLLQIIEERTEEIDQRLIQAQVNLNAMDCSKMIAEEERHLKELEKEKKSLLARMQELEAFQDKVNEMMTLLGEAGYAAEDPQILAGLCDRGRFSAVEKELAVERLKNMVEAGYDQMVQELGSIHQKLSRLEDRLEKQMRIAEECRRHRNTYTQIPEYVGLREEINQEFQKRKIPSKAQFACEYVIGLTDESWRDAIEAFLGARRYTILVEPEYYDIADDVLNRSKYRYAHLFNTRLLMQKKIDPKADSPVHFLKIRNQTAQKYFDYQLGRIHGVDLEDVRNYENAVSREGRVSVAMDSYFLRFDRIQAYYLGQETFELNRIRAEREAENAKAEKKELLAKKEEITAQKNRLGNARTFFRSYHFDAHEAYQKAARQCEASEEQLAALKKAQEENREYMELYQMVEKLGQEKEGVKQEQQEKLKQISELTTLITSCEEKLKQKTAEAEEARKNYREYEITVYPVVQKAVEAYEKFLQNGNRGLGGLMQPQSRRRTEQKIEKSKQDLLQLQSVYLAHYPESGLTAGTEERKLYAARKDKIWMDNLQEIRQKLKDQTRRYEEIFKNEFVLTILKSCERAREELREINIELAKLQFSAKYQFSVDYIKDGSEYTQIIRYARYLDEREQLGGTGGQQVLDILGTHSQEEAEQLEQDLKKIINRVIEQNSEEAIARFADYRNYMTYEILITNDVLDHAKLSRQTGFNSGAEVQIPYLLILISALLMIYNQKTNSTRLVFIDEPFAKMDPGNVKIMLDFMRRQGLQVIFCSPDKTETIGDECEVILPVLRIRTDSMCLGAVQFHQTEGRE